MAEKKTPARHRRTDEEVTSPAPAPAAPSPAPSKPAERPVQASCRLPGCGGTPEWRGLCSAHRQTHRGLAAPKEGRDD